MPVLSRGAAMRRRDFIGIAGGAVGWPFVAHAQQRRIGVLMPFAKDDAEGQARVTAFLRELQQLGWTEGGNIQIEYRWDTGDLRKAATELVTLSPDVILANGAAAVEPLLQASRSVPIVFAIVPDPVGSGFVDSLAQPGGNATGFLMFE